MPTVRLFDDTPYETSFTGTVVSTQPGGREGTAQIVLDRTLFFPEEGGQTPDRGILGGFPVLDVQVKDNVITHTVQAPSDAFVPGAKVSGEIDWSHRFSNMQNHSGEHILSGLLHSLYGYDNVGFRLSDNTVTLDTSGQLTDEQLRDLERRANEVVYRNVPIHCEYPSPEVLKTLDYRSKKPIDGPVRIVTIEGVDVCACCAPHVQRTGEIGLIRILDVLHTKTNMRLTIVCGMRALEETQKEQEQLLAVSHLANAPRLSCAEGVQHLLDEILSLKEQLKTDDIRYVDTRLREIDLLEKMQNDADVTGASTASDNTAAKCGAGSMSARSLWVFEAPMNVLAQRNFMNQLCERGYRFAGVFTGSDEEGWHYLIGSREDDARIPGDLLRKEFGAKGGGKPAMVQGTVHAAQAAIRAILP